MKIVILDGGTTNPGDISWEPLEKLGSLTCYDTTAREDIPVRAYDADAVILNRINMDQEIMEQLPNLKYIGTLSTGYNTIDIKYAAQRGITVCNVPLYCAETVAQMTFALLLELCNHVSRHSLMVHEGKWNESISAGLREWFELRGKNLGIIGYGNIGRKVADIGRAFGMNILVHSRSHKELPAGDRFVSLEELAAQSDVISVHCPLTDETRGLIDKNTLSLMKKSTLIVNTSRGAVINEKDLADALNNGAIAGAGLDVMSAEPPKADDPLLSAPNCIITPHIAWSSREARTRLVDTVAENLSRFMEGIPQNQVN